MNSVEFFAKSIISELYIAVPSLIVGAINKFAGMALGAILLFLGLFFIFKQYDGDQPGFFEFGIPSIIATIGVELILYGIDASGLLVFGIIYSCIWLIIDVFTMAIKSIFRVD